MRSNKSNEKFIRIKQDDMSVTNGDILKLVLAGLFCFLVTSYVVTLMHESSPERIHEMLFKGERL